MTAGAGPEEIRSLTRRRGITEIVHFTTNRGVLGVLATGSVKSRDLLTKDEYLERIFRPNANYRRDGRWTSYVNLSVSRINSDFFRTSEGWHAHEPVWWAVLAFDPEILCHDNVLFTTTNNIYTSVVRGGGEAGLERLFAEQVTQYGGNRAHRYPGMPSNLTTCVQAEVLYPSQLNTDFLRRIYVSLDEHAAVVEGQIAASGHRPIEVVVAPAVFA